MKQSVTTFVVALLLALLGATNAEGAQVTTRVTLDFRVEEKPIRLFNPQIKKFVIVEYPSKVSLPEALNFIPKHHIGKQSLLRSLVKQGLRPIDALNLVFLTYTSKNRSPA